MLVGKGLQPCLDPRPSPPDTASVSESLFGPQRRLGDAAKKAISKLQVRTIRKGDQETETDFDNCAVCIEGYKANDVVRILPCR